MIEDIPAGGVGDGDLTRITQYPDSDPAHARVTEYAYDWRDRMVAAKSGVQPTEARFQFFEHALFDRKAGAMPRPFG